MERVLVTGPLGFVGRHLRDELGEAFLPFEGDVLDADAIAAAVRETQPSALVHLAADSSVAASWDHPTRVWWVNVAGTVNVLEAIRSERPEARVLFPSTSEVYGNASRFPTPEDEPVRPISPYAVTKAAAELACALPGVEVVVARSFNHEGPGRDDRFAIGSWTRQIARLEAEGGGTLLVGDLSAERDLTDVRDVARAYALLLDPAVAAETYNVASGVSVTMEHVLELLVGLARVPVQVERDESRVRPADIRRLCGDPAKLRAATGWTPEIPLEQTLADALAAARELEPVS
ncbi:MAG TPA: GDP-mannose 4,6-dehydratase [Gaiellaceae bacterium]|nr:GDP-mannose 4,6-dehydratase [Gaiellaceae bacterium]